MAIGRDKEELSVMEAVDILSNMSEVDLKAPIDFDAEEEELSLEINWRDPRHAMRNEGLIKEAFRVIHRYLQNIVRKDRQVLNDPQILKGIQAIILLANEAAAKMDRFAATYPKDWVDGPSVGANTRAPRRQSGKGRNRAAKYLEFQGRLTTVTVRCRVARRLGMEPGRVGPVWSEPMSD